MRFIKQSLAAALLLTSTLVPTAHTSVAHTSVAHASVAQDGGQVLNFRDADIRAFIEDVSLLTGQTFIIDPAVRSTITLVSRDPVPTEDLFDLFLSTLRVYGYTAVPTSAGAYKIVPAADAVTDTPTQTSPGASDENLLSDQLVTHIFRLNYIDPLTALDTVKPLINKQGKAIAHRNNDFLLIVDYAGNMAHLRRVIGDLDQDTRTTRLVSLENTSAGDMAETLLGLRGSGYSENTRDASAAIIPIPGGNTLLIKADLKLADELTNLARELDKRNASKSDIRVIKLKYADAEELKPMLEEISKSLKLTENITPGGANIGTSHSPNTRASISFHKGTNTLVINASPDMQKALDSVIQQLDIARAQVLVEAIIVEISDQAAKELGVQYILSGSEGSNVPFTATNYSNTAPNILAAAGALLLDTEFTDSDGGTSNSVDNLRTAAIDSLLGVNGFVGGIAGEKNGTLFGVIVNALQQDVASNILSTPSLMTLDNAEAKLLVGQEIPITTGEALGNNNSNPFRTIEREEVGISLKVRPQIGENNDILLVIDQEVSSVQGTVGPTLGELITNKRQITTTVRVADGDIIVLGGLIQQDERISLSKVPLLGDIPLLGELFKSTSKRLEKTNLMVFLRPKIIRTQAENQAATARKFNIARQEQLLRYESDGARPAAIDVILEEVIGGAPVPTNRLPH